MQGPMRPIPSLGHAATDAYLGRLVSRADDVLGDQLVGISLINSAARDDYLPGRSDLDVTVVVDRELDEATKLRLADALRHRSLPCAAPRLELVVYRRAVLANPGARPAFELNQNTGPAIEDLLETAPADEPPHWFVLDLAAGRDRSVSLVGPPLSDLVGPIPDVVVIEALGALLGWHDLHDTVAANRVLNACRAWRWLDERCWSSKTDAAMWAIAAGADRELIELALAGRRGETSKPLPAKRVARLTDVVERHLT